MLLTKSIGKTTNAPTAPAIPPSVKSYTPPAISDRVLVAAAGAAELTVGAGGAH